MNCHANDQITSGRVSPFLKSLATSGRALDQFPRPRRAGKDVIGRRRCRPHRGTARREVSTHGRRLVLAVSDAPPDRLAPGRHPPFPDRRRRSPLESANGKTGQGKSLSSDSARARSQQQQKEASRRAAGRAGAHPYRRRRSASVRSFLRCIPTIQSETKAFLSVLF